MFKIKDRSGAHNTENFGAGSGVCYDGVYYLVITNVFETLNGLVNLDNFHGVDSFVDVEDAYHMTLEEVEAMCKKAGIDFHAAEMSTQGAKRGKAG